MKAKRIVSFIVVFFLLIGWTHFTSIEVKAQSSEHYNLEPSRDMDELEILLAMYYFVAGSPSEDHLWPDSVKILHLIPLFDNQNNKIAYYLKLVTGQYAVVNNNINNPALIEYGVGGNEYIDAILYGDDLYKIVYENPTNLYNQYEISKVRLTNNTENEYSNYYINYNDLKGNNDSLSYEILKLKQIVLEENHTNLQGNISPLGDGDYGFINWANMPTGTYSSGNLPFGKIDWAITDSFTDIASNHCGAVLVTNLALYFANRGYTSLKINDNIRSTFIAVHKIVGNGPVMTVASKAKTYFNNRGHILNSSTVSSYTDVKDAINKGRPLGILLEDGIVSWHWILGVGWRQYSSGGNYIRIVDGWNNTTFKFYKIHSGSTWWSATEYWIY